MSSRSLKIDVVQLSALLLGVLLGIYAVQQNSQKTVTVSQALLPCITPQAHSR